MKVVIRLLLTILGAALGYSLGILIYMLAVSSFTEEMQASAKTVEIATPVVGAVIVGALAFFISGRMVKNWGRIGQRLETNISRFSAFQLIGGGLGLILGLLAAYLISGLLGNIRIL